MSAKAGQGWPDLVLAQLRQHFKPGQPFTSVQVYERILPALKQQRPDAANVEARIRDALQQLKRAKAVDFLERGRYELRK